MIGSGQLAAALLLVAAGVAKLRAPQQAAAMLHRAWPTVPRGSVGRIAVRGAGAFELAVGVLVIVLGDRVAAALLAGCYLAFLAVATRLLSGGQRGSCGCFGAAESPVGAAHVVLNLVGVGVGAAAAAVPPGPLGGWLDARPLVAVVGVGQAVLLAYLAYLSITALPALVAARRRLLEAA